MKLIQNNKNYWEFIRNLRNDLNNLNGFVNKNYISLENQIIYMTKYNDSYYICLDENDLPVGFIGEIENDIRICVEHSFKNKGIGKFMLNEFLKIKNNRNMAAKIKIDNIISQRLFQGLGFKAKYIIYEQE